MMVRIPDEEETAEIITAIQAAKVQTDAPYSLMPSFSLDSYEIVREPGESNEDYAARRRLFE